MPVTLLPDALRKTALLAIPVVLVFLLMLYWLARALLFKRRDAVVLGGVNSRNLQ